MAQHAPNGARVPSTGRPLQPLCACAFVGVAWRVLQRAIVYYVVRAVQCPGLPSCPVLCTLLRPLEAADQPEARGYGYYDYE